MKLRKMSLEDLAKVYETVAGGESVLIICKTVDTAADEFARMRSFLDSMCVEYKARPFDKQVKLPNGAFVKFGAIHHEQRTRPHKGGFGGVVVWSE